MAQAKIAITVRSENWDRLRLHSLLSKWKGKRILVVGDVGVDRYTIGTVERISPEAPVPVLRVEEEQLKLGLAANVADNLVALGAEPWLIGALGRDRAAGDFRHLLEANSISDAHLVEDATRRTIVKERVVTERQQMIRIDYESTHGIGEKAAVRLHARVMKLMRRCDAVIVSDYAKGLLDAKLLSKVFAEARRFGKPVVVDPKKADISSYRGASCLKPNLKEAEKLSGLNIVDEKSLFEAGRKILKTSRAESVIITRGKEGMAVFQAGERNVHFIPTYAREVYDVSGAGDTVISALTLAISSGASLDEAAILGNLAAGVVVGKRGTATVTPNEIKTAMEFHGAIQ